jgi:hypothetical protein
MLQRAVNQEHGVTVRDEKGILMYGQIIARICFVDHASLYNLVNIFLQHFEDIHIKPFLDTKNILLYTQYEDDILIIYDTKQELIHTPSMHT